LTREGQIIILEQILGVEFPHSYKKFLLEHSYRIVDGFKILGLPIKSTQNWKIKSVIEGTQYLRLKRPELPRYLVVISFNGTNALCLDLEKRNNEDAPLVEVDLTKGA
jgi:hypothetical protein